jgi:hypothetical protein
MIDSSRTHRLIPRLARVGLIAALTLALAACGSSHPTATVPTKTPAQIRAVAHARALAKARAVRLAARKRAQAKAQALAAARRAKIAARARAKAAAAAYAAANRWHQGYLLYSESLAYKWLDPSSFNCSDYALNGCWKIEVIALDGCSYLEVDSNEMKGGAIVGSLLANQANVPPETPVIFELTADADSVQASAPTITCN